MRITEDAAIVDQVKTNANRMADMIVKSSASGLNGVTFNGLYPDPRFPNVPSLQNTLNANSASGLVKQEWADEFVRQTEHAASQSRALELIRTNPKGFMDLVEQEAESPNSTFLAKMDPTRRYSLNDHAIANESQRLNKLEAAERKADVEYVDDVKLSLDAEFEAGTLTMAKVLAEGDVIGSGSVSHFRTLLTSPRYDGPEDKATVEGLSIKAASTRPPTNIDA